jgi:hypothetical protein
LGKCDSSGSGLKHNAALHGALLDTREAAP